MKNLTTEQFKELFFDFKKIKNASLKISKPVILDFSATWCGPCKAMVPLLEQVPENIDVYKIDVDDEHELSSFFKIRSVPTIIFIPSTESPNDIKYFVGMQNKQDFNKNIKEIFDI